jgi:hypothetical protein
MSIRTTVTLDEDVLERVKADSQKRGTSFRDALNDLIRLGLVARANPPDRSGFRIRPFHGGYIPGLNYDCTEALLTYAEGEDHR